MSTASYFSFAIGPAKARQETRSGGWFLFNLNFYVLLTAKTSLKCMPNDTWKPLKKILSGRAHMQYSYMHPWIWGHFLPPHMFVMQFSHSHNYVKSKPTDVSAKMLSSPIAKLLYIWEVLMCDINILPSKATMYTRTSKPISIICTETHTHIYTEDSPVYFYVSVTIVLGNPPLPLHKYIAVVNKKIHCVGTVNFFFSWSAV